MADEQPVEKLALVFASRYFAYQRPAQGFSRSMWAFSSYTPEYLDHVIKADQFAQDVDDIGIASSSQATDHQLTSIFRTFQMHSNRRIQTTHSKPPLWNWKKLISLDEL